MSKIEWTDRSDWNPVRGCTRVSEGCRHCYAEIMAARFSEPGQWGHGFAQVTGGDHRWTGRVELQEDRLTLPLKWRKPAKIFVCSTADLFHEALPDAAIDKVFAVMALCPQHTFQVLTKRAARMRDYFAKRHSHNEVELAAERLRPSVGTPFSPKHILRWPLPNVWLGVSVEDQRAARERVPLLEQTPAAKRFVSAEPSLDRLDLTNCGVHYTGSGPLHLWRPGKAWCRQHGEPRPGIDWVIVGGESGPGARPFNVMGAMELIVQCRVAGVPIFVKQLGARPVGPDGSAIRLNDRKGGDMAEWPEDLRVREFPT